MSGWSIDPAIQVLELCTDRTIVLYVRIRGCACTRVVRFGLTSAHRKMARMPGRLYSGLCPLVGAITSPPFPASQIRDHISSHNQGALRDDEKAIRRTCRQL